MKRGITVFVLEDSTNGHVCAIGPYMGKSTTDNLIRSDLLVTSTVLLSLVIEIELFYRRTTSVNKS